MYGGSQADGRTSVCASGLRPPGSDCLPDYPAHRLHWRHTNSIRERKGKRLERFQVAGDLGCLFVWHTFKRWHLTVFSVGVAHKFDDLGVTQ